MNTYIEELEKGRKPLPVGTIKDWKGGKYIKTATGWKPYRTGANGAAAEPRGRGRPKGSKNKSPNEKLDAYVKKMLDPKTDQDAIKEEIINKFGDGAYAIAVQKVKDINDAEYDTPKKKMTVGKKEKTKAPEKVEAASDDEPIEMTVIREKMLKIKEKFDAIRSGKLKLKDTNFVKFTKKQALDSLNEDFMKLKKEYLELKKENETPQSAEKEVKDNTVVKVEAPITDKKLAAELKKKVFRRSSDSGSVNELYDEYLPPSFVKGIYKLGDYYFAIHKTSANDKFLKLTNLETGLSAGTGKGVEGVIENFNKLHIQNGKLNAVVKNEIGKHAGKTYPRKDYEYSESEKKDIEKKNAKTKAYADAVKAEVEDTSPTSKTGAVRARKVTDKALVEKITNSFYQSSSIDGTKRDPVTGVLESFEVKIKIPPEKIKGVLEIGDGHYAVLAEIYSMRERAQDNKLQVNDYESGARVYQSGMEFAIRSANLPVKSSLGSVNDAIYHVNKGIQLAVGDTGITEDMYKKAISDLKERRKDAKVFESYEDFLKFKKEVGAPD